MTIIYIEFMHQNSICKDFVNDSILGDLHLESRAVIMSLLIITIMIYDSCAVVVYELLHMFSICVPYYKVITI